MPPWESVQRGALGRSEAHSFRAIAGGARNPLSGGFWTGAAYCSLPRRARPQNPKMECGVIQIPLGMPNGYVLWEGESLLAGSPIVAIITGIHGTTNRKTGRMLQTWILCQTTTPGEAKRTGEDEAVCGNCAFRMHAQGGCYVGMWGPSSIWKAWKAGKYPKIDHSAVSYIKETQHLRFGSYGDPVAVPVGVWKGILPNNSKHSTGYTSQWRLPQAKTYRDFLMASTKSPAETAEAQAKGWRTFEVLPLDYPVPEGALWCPSDRLNPSKKLSCERCGACSGARGGTASIVIYAHGPGAALFGTKRQRLPTTNSISRTKYNELPLVRMDPDIHNKLKLAAKSKGKSMRRFVEEILIKSGEL